MPYQTQVFAQQEARTVDNTQTLQLSDPGSGRCTAGCHVSCPNVSVSRSPVPSDNA